MLKLTPQVEAARRRFRHRGDVRPEFAHAGAAHEESVWDYPRPRGIVPDVRLVQVFVEGSLVVDSRDCVRVLETAHPPTFYVPPDDVEWGALVATDERTRCEWKGIATVYDALVDGEGITAAAWAFHDVYPQPGDLGGWVTREILGPFKGGPGTDDW